MRAQPRLVCVESLETRRLLSAVVTLSDNSHVASYSAASLSPAKKFPLPTGPDLAATVTTLQSSATTVDQGASVTFTVTVAPATAGGPTPTGTVTLSGGLLIPLSGFVRPDGTAVFSTSILPTGKDSITASYSGDSVYEPSTSPVLVESVGLKMPTINLRSSMASINFGTPLTLTASISPDDVRGDIPTGTVRFVANGTIVLNVVTLNGTDFNAGDAVISTSALPVGTDTLVAMYSGDGNYLSGSSQVLTEVVTSSTSQSTITTLSALPTSVTMGSSITFTATVSAAVGGSGTPTGTMMFLDGGTPFGNGTIGNDGVATFSTSTLTAGSHNITASYGGDSGYASSISSAVTVQVGVVSTPTASMTSLSASASSITAGASITFTAAVSSAVGGATPTGTITFLDGTVVLGSVTIGSDGTAAFTISSLVVGDHNITASYVGNAAYSPSTSSVLIIAVIVSLPPAASVTSVTASSSSAVPGETVTFTATVSAAAGSGTAPTGTIIFLDNGITIGTVAIGGNGIALLSISTLSIGIHVVTASYGGDANYTASISVTFTETVAVPASTTTPGIGRIALPIEVIAGAKFISRLPVLLTNSGSVLSGQFTVHVFISVSVTLDGTAVPLGSLVKKLKLGNNASTTVNTAVNPLPATLPDGDYYLLIEIIDPTGATNLSASATTVHVAAPFVALGASVGSVIPTTLVVKKSGSVKIIVTNTGNEIASGSLHLTLGLSIDGLTLLTGGTPTTMAKHVVLKPGKSHTYRLRFKVPATATPGSYYPLLTVSLAGISATAAGMEPFNIGE